jgi:hypothetical protein
VDWDTTAKTASFTAVSGNGYFVNTTSGAITVTLPATPSAGDIVAIKDYANTADTNVITIARNGSNIDGTTSNPVIANEGGSVTLIYADATKGWLVTDAAQKSDLGFPTYIVATGGTITTCGDYKIHTFTGPGTFTVCSIGNPIGSTTVDYLVVAGGAGSGDYFGAGGGAGGYRESSGAASGCYTTSPLGTCVSALPVSVQGYPIAVGGGGAGGSRLCGPNNGVSGGNSTFSSITSTGGGGGGGANGPAVPGNPGGSGGGGGGAGANALGGTGNTPPVSPPQGNNGGGNGPGGNGSGGGGGAGGAGASRPPAGDGGVGAGTAINPLQGTPGPSPSVKYFAGGGNGTGGGTGGYGGGGTGTPGAVNTGGGAGTEGLAGGSGIVIIRYRYQ